MSDTYQILRIRIRLPYGRIACDEFDALLLPISTGLSRSQRISKDDAEDVIQHWIACVHTDEASFDADLRFSHCKDWVVAQKKNCTKPVLRKRVSQFADSFEHIRLYRESLEPIFEFDRFWLRSFRAVFLRELFVEASSGESAAFGAYVIHEIPTKDVCQRFSLELESLYKTRWRLIQDSSTRMPKILDEQD